jgi:hypothetical protein
MKLSRSDIRNLGVENERELCNVVSDIEELALRRGLSIEDADSEVS